MQQMLFINCTQLVYIYTKTAQYMTASQHEQRRQNRLMIAARMMAALVRKADIHRRDAAKETADMAVRYADELLKRLEP